MGTARVVVAGLLLALFAPRAAHATEQTIKYKLAAGARSAFIKLPANTSVLVMGNQTVTGDIGVGQVVMQNVPAEGLQWAGSSSFDGPVNSYSGATGTYIMSIDYVADVELRIDFVKDNFGFIIENFASETLTGEVKLIY